MIPGIDLHMHTMVSDGTDTPQEILENVKKAGIQMFSVTDHDAVKGCRMLLDLVTEDDPQFITGVEFSCRDALGKYHVLGYHYDPDAEAIQQVVDLGHGYRIQKAAERLDFLKGHEGITFSEDEVAWFYAQDNPGKPHLAQLLVKHGYASDNKEAFAKYLNRIQSSPMQYVQPEEAIQAILKSGGIPVLAHPSYGSGDELILGDEMRERLERLIGFGLQGVEAIYSGFTPKLRSENLSFADEYHLYVTAGSDYHGKNKTILLGDTGLRELAALPEGLIRFLDQVGMK